MGRVSLDASHRRTAVNIHCLASGYLLSLLDRDEVLHSRVRGEAVDAGGVIPHIFVTSVWWAREFRATSAIRSHRPMGGSAML